VIAADLLHDLRYGARALRRAPGFTLLVVASLGLGIGANAAIFSLVNALYLRPLPAREPGRLVVFDDGASEGRSTVLVPGRLNHLSYPMYQRMRAETRAFEDVAAQQSAPATLRVGPGDRATARLVTANYFALLGVWPALGRAFAAGNQSEAEVVLSDRYWRRRFGGDRAVLGRRVWLDGRPHTVVGVAPPGFVGLNVGAHTDLWRPIGADPPGYLDRAGDRWLLVVGRLRPGVSLAAADADVNRVLQQFLADRRGEVPFVDPARASPASVHIALAPGGRGVSPLRPGFGQPLAALMAGVGLLLLIVCLNLSHLLLARALVRQREMGIRAALGAGRGRLVRQLLAEGLLLGGAGAGVAALASGWASEALLAMAASGRAALDLDVAPDLRVAGFIAAVAALAVLLLGLVPAWPVLVGRAASLHQRLAWTSLAMTAGARRRRGARALLVSQVAVSLVLLVGAGLLVTSLQRLRAVDPGFARERLLLAELDPAGPDGTGTAGFPRFARARLAKMEGARAVAAYDDVLRKVEAIPGVSAASLSRRAALGGGGMFVRIFARGTVAAPDPVRPAEVGWNLGIATARFFETMGMPVVRGRGFDRADREGAPRVAVVNEALARQFFGGPAVALGKRFRFGTDDAAAPDVEVVGVVGDTRHRDLREPPRPTAWVPAAQRPDDRLGSLEVRALGDPARLAAEVRRAVAEVAPQLTVLGVRTMQAQIERSLMKERLMATLSITFGVAALLLVCLGLYGVMAEWAGQRTRELGLRMALGATAGGVRWLVLRQALVLVVAGLVVGLPAALAGGRMLSGFLFGIEPTDAATLGAAALVLVAPAALAAYLPARRASRVTPMAALRAE
jgi:predicted permease